jgi:hypothetical protein
LNTDSATTVNSTRTPPTECGNVDGRSPGTALSAADRARWATVRLSINNTTVANTVSISLTITQ